MCWFVRMSEMMRFKTVDPRGPSYPRSGPSSSIEHPQACSSLAARAADPRSTSRRARRQRRPGASPIRSSLIVVAAAMLDDDAHAAFLPPTRAMG